jgi:hypothetical protein
MSDVRRREAMAIGGDGEEAEECQRPRREC